MKETRKKTFKLLLFLCVLFSTFYSCQDEDYIIENSIENKTFLAHKNKEFIFQNKDILNKLKSIENKQKSNYLGKSTKENFKIFYDKTTYYFSAEKNEETYSFLIERKKLGEKYLENLILRRKINDANFKSYIITYFLANGANSKKEDCKVVGFEEIEIDSKVFSRCEGNDYVINEIQHSCHSGEHSGAAEEGSCNYEKVGKEGPSSTWTVLVLPCQDQGGGSGSGPGSNNGLTWGVGVTGSNGGVASVINEFNDKIGNTLNKDELQWLYNSSGKIVGYDIFLNQNSYSLEAKKWVKGQIELETLVSKITIKWNPKSGKINSREGQEYTHIYSDGLRTYYKMADGSTVINSDESLTLNKDGKLVQEHKTDTGNSKVWYIKPNGMTSWSNYLIKETTSTSDDLRLLLKLGVKDLAIGIGTYVIPVEDIKILIDGKDFAGQSTSRWLAAGMLLMEVVPGGKLLKATVKITKAEKVWRIVVKVGNKTYTRVVREITQETLKHFDKYAPNTSKLIDDAFRSGNYTDDVINEASEVIEDLVTKKKAPYTWAEIKALFKRGNDFNKKAVKERWYSFHEIHLVNGKRLDSYDDVAKEIISRKATNLQNVKFATFEGYLKELTSKYKVGTKIRSNKYLDDLDGKLLEGTYVLEIPEANQSLGNIQQFIDYAWNNYKVKIRFRPE